MSPSVCQVCVLALHLSKELCRADEDGEQWLQVVRKLPVLPSVLSALELSLRSKQNLYFTEAALHLLLTLARTPQVHTCYHTHRHLKVNQLTNLMSQNKSDFFNALCIFKHFCFILPGL